MEVKKSGLKKTSNVAMLGNIIFCRPETTIIEFLPNQNPVILFYAVANAMGLRYSLILANDESCHASPMTVDVGKLDRLIHKVSHVSSHEPT